MDKLSFVKRLESSNMSVFTIAQISSVLHKNIESTRVLLSRFTKEGVLVRIKRGRYCLPSAHILSVSTNIYPPSYVSLWAAFEYYGTTTQSPQIIDIINPYTSSKEKIRLEDGFFTVRFIKTQKSFIYGIRKVYINGKTAFIAEKEKAIIDGLIFHRYIPLDEIVETLRDGVDVTRLIAYAAQSNKQAIMKRLGYLLNQQGSNCNPNDFYGLTNTFVPLNPSLPLKGTYDSTWHIIDNRRKT